MPNGTTTQRRFVVCINNKGYEAALEVRKVYRILKDSRSDQHGLLRVIDESGEDYLYEAGRFVPVTLARVPRRLFAATA